MIRAILLGALAALFLSGTFVINRLLFVSGIHWFWPGAIRFPAIGLVILPLYLRIALGKKGLRQAWQMFCGHWWFWLGSGFISFFIGYAVFCYAIVKLPGWAAAAGWQITVIATPIVLKNLFHRNVPAARALTSLVIFSGVLLTTLGGMDLTNWKMVAISLPLLTLAAFLWPISNQMLREAQLGEKSWAPKISNPLLHNAIVCNWCINLGATPFWLALGFWIRPPAPTLNQIAGALLLAIFTGVIGVSLILFARSKVKTGGALVAVDATQSLQVVYTVIIGTTLFGDTHPGVLAIIGIVIIIGGILFHAVDQSRQN